ncbi:MAG: hypothetical protein WC974_09360 [Thermoplasmata archaeon]
MNKLSKLIEKSKKDLSQLVEYAMYKDDEIPQTLNEYKKESFVDVALTQAYSLGQQDMREKCENICRERYSDIMRRCDEYDAKILHGQIDAITFIKSQIQKLGE